MTTIVDFMPRPHHVVALALPSVILLDLAAPTHLFGHCGEDRYRFTLAGVRRGPIETSTGFAISTQSGLRALRAADTIVVPGTDDLAVTPDVRRAAAALRQAHARGARIVSICTGAFVLGEAGLLDGRRATTHWHSTAELARRFPATDVDPDVLYVDEGVILTSAGVAAGLDLCLHLVRRDHGAAVAAQLARRVVIAPHREGGQAQFIAGPADGPATDGSTECARTWALAHLDGPLPVSRLARQASMSPRTFARRFRAEMGVTPARWVREQRVRRAQVLLETTGEPVEAVAHRSGFTDAAALRACFARRLGTTPTGYRLRFGGPR
jgi:AraC family transcriptional regulator, transcriptional activator FtrA